MHFLRNALDYLPRRADDDCLQELRWIDERRDIQEAWQDVAAWIGKWQGKYLNMTFLSEQKKEALRLAA